MDYPKHYGKAKRVLDSIYFPYNVTPIIGTAKTLAQNLYKNQTIKE